MTLLSLAARFSRPALCTLRPRSFFHSSQKRARDDYTDPKSLGLLPQASDFTLAHIDLLKLSFKGASAEKDVIPEVKSKNYIVSTILLTKLMLTTLNIVLVTDVLDQYVAPHVTYEDLCSKDFNVLKFGCISDP